MRAKRDEVRALVSSRSKDQHYSALTFHVLATRAHRVAAGVGLAWQRDVTDLGSDRTGPPLPRLHHAFERWEPFEEPPCIQTQHVLDGQKVRLRFANTKLVPLTVPDRN